MIRNLLRYLAVLLCTVIFFLCYNGYLSQYILILTLLFPPVVFLVSLPGILGIRLTLETGAASTVKGRDVPLRLKVDSRFPVVSGRAAVTLVVRNTLTGEMQRERFTFTACRGKQSLDHRLIAASCGQVVCSLTNGWAWDYLGIIPLPLRLRSRTRTVTVYPAMYETYLTLDRGTTPDSESDSYSQTKPGDDPSELFGLREYRPGDRLTRVHWKLSQKNDQTLVKELGLPIDDHILFFLELNGTGKEADGLLDAFATLSDFLSAQETAHRVCFSGAQGPVILEIADREDLKPLLNAVMAAGRQESLRPETLETLPGGVSHGIYLTCAPEERTVAFLRQWSPQARLSVIHVTETPEERDFTPPADVTLIIAAPSRIAEGLEDFRL